MATPAFRQGSSFNSVVQGNTATLEMPTGMYMYNRFFISYQKAGVNATSAEVFADILQVRVLVDGEAVHKYTPEQIRTVDNWHNRRNYDHHVVCSFTRPELRSFDASRILGLGTGNVKNLTVEVDLAPDVLNVAPTLKLYANLEQSAAPMGEFVSIKSHNVIIKTSGSNFEYDDLPVTGSNKRLLGFHMLGAFQPADKVRVFFDDKKIVDLETNEAYQAYIADLQADTIQTGGRNSQGLETYRHIEFYRNALSQAPIMDMGVFRLEIETAIAAGVAVPTITEVVHNLKV